MHDESKNSATASVPRVLIELESGEVKRIVADRPIVTITIDSPGSAGTPDAVGLVASRADEVFAGRDFDRLLQNQLDRVRKMICHPAP